MTPNCSQTLEELAKVKDIVLISSDHTRPVPSHIITPIILRRVLQRKTQTLVSVF